MDYSYSKTNDGARTDEYEFRSIDLVSKILLAMLLAGLLTLVLSLISDLMQYALLSRSYSQQEGDANDARVRFIELGYAGFLLLTIPVFATWIVQAHRNLPALGAERLDVTPGWALGWFF